MDKPFQLVYHKVPAFDQGEGTHCTRVNNKENSCN